MDYLTKQDAIKLFGEIAQQRIDAVIENRFTGEFENFKLKLEKLDAIDRILNDLKFLFKGE